MIIKIAIIPHKKQKYPTVGNYYLSPESSACEEDVWQFDISKMSNWKYEFLVLIHELIEWALIMIANIPIEEIDSFDINYEKNRPEGDVTEPGDSHDAPYYTQHRIATIIERLVAHFIGVSWEDYEKEVESL